MPRRRFKGVAKRKLNEQVLSSGNKKIISVLLIVVFLCLLFFAGYLLFFSSYFNIKILDVKAEKTPCVSKGELKDQSQILGQNFFTASEIGAKRNLTGKYICVKNLTLTKYFPDRAKLEITGREPVAILVGIRTSLFPSEIKTEATASAQLEPQVEVSTDSATVLAKEASPSALLDFSKIRPVSYFLIDDDGIIFSSNIENINAPKLYIEAEGLALGKKLSSSLVKNFLYILEKLKAFGVATQEAKIYSQKALVINSNPKLIFSLDKTIDPQLASLQLILEKAKIEETEMEFVDTRFDNPVVKFAPKKGESSR